MLCKLCPSGGILLTSKKHHLRCQFLRLYRHKKVNPNKEVQMNLYRITVGGGHVFFVIADGHMAAVRMVAKAERPGVSLTGKVEVVEHTLDEGVKFHLREMPEVPGMNTSWEEMSEMFNGPTL